MVKSLLSINLKKPAKINILFLGYSKKQTRLIEELIFRNCEVYHTSDKIYSTKGFDIVISFGYRHILSKDIVRNSVCPLINLHISFLPWNRGAHSNFWSFYDSTPSGVTIHLIDEGIDTGPIIYQRLVNFDNSEDTFTKTYFRLIDEVELLFIDNIDEILQQNFVARPQFGFGTYHNSRELPKDFLGWDSIISYEIARLHKIHKG